VDEVVKEDLQVLDALQIVILSSVLSYEQKDVYLMSNTPLTSNLDNFFCSL